MAADAVPHATDAGSTGHAASPVADAAPHAADATLHATNAGFTADATPLATDAGSASGATVDAGEGRRG
uniref:Uncharacterized protein n=1 Tax=Oryza punctata TaxID=4537 RepID=A0A0E0KTV2_ORYPU